MTAAWQPYREPMRTTLVRTITIALVVATIASRWLGWSRWPLVVLLMLWPSFGGHWVELWFLNWLRPRLPAGRGVQVTARVAVWFVGGIALAVGMALTAAAIGGFRPVRWPVLWLGGMAFIVVELVAQAALQLRGRPSFYNGRG
jgi:hypothetical protein